MDGKSNRTGKYELVGKGRTQPKVPFGGGGTTDKVRGEKAKKKNPRKKGGKTESLKARGRI